MGHWTIFWDYQAKNSFLFGSNLTVKAPDSIVFQNGLLPPGVEIHDWKSKIQFQANRTTNTMPVLLPGKKYWLKSNILCPKNSIYFKLSFFNRYQECIESLILRDMISSFICPDEVSFYQISLMNNGVQTFYFSSIEIADFELKESIFGYAISEMQQESKSEPLTIIFSEPIPREVVHISKEYLKPFKNVQVISSSLNEAHLYLEEEFKEEMVKFYSKTQSNGQSIIFVGYGPISNLAAAYYALQFPNAIAEISGEWLPADKYQDIIDTYYLSGLGIVSEWLQIVQHIPKKVRIYGKNRVISSEDVFWKLRLRYEELLYKAES